jgi:hypothetical protein
VIFRVECRIDGWYFLIFWIKRFFLLSTLLPPPNPSMDNKDFTAHLLKEIMSNPMLLYTFLHPQNTSRTLHPPLYMQLLYFLEYPAPLNKQDIPIFKTKNSIIKDL